MRNYIKSVCISLILASFCNAQNSNVKSWIEDIDFYHKILEEKHIDLYHTISKADFTADIQNIKSKLPQLSDFQITVELMRLTHKIGAGKGDGHTSVPLWGMKLHRYPIKLFDFGNEIRVIEASKNHKTLLGKKLKSINGIAIEKVYSMISELTPFTENKQSSMLRVCSYLLVAEILNALNITENLDQSKFIFEDDDGNELSIVLKSYAEEASKKIEYESISIGHPEIQEPDSTKLKGLWSNALNNNQTIYIKFHEYPSKPEEMMGFAQETLDFINTHNSKNLIIDLRDNYGGDFYLGLLLPWFLNLADSIDWQNGVYVLTDRITFSAAMVNAVQLRQLLNAKVVGEPTGANPNGYQDMAQFNLPNSKLLITCSKRLFRIQDENTNGVQPDILIVPKWENYKKGHDEVLEWVLSDVIKK